MSRRRVGIALSAEMASRDCLNVRHDGVCGTAPSPRQDPAAHSANSVTHIRARMAATSLSEVRTAIVRHGLP
jgi:hypothetical protein